MKIFLASDIDGTLLKHNQGLKYNRTILDEDIEALKRFTQQNCLIISTGRNKISTFTLFDHENLHLKNTYYITSNGAEIYDSDRQCIFQMTLKKEVAIRAIELFNALNADNNLLCSVFDGTTIHLLEKTSDINKIPDFNTIINICVESKNKNISEIQSFYKQAQTFTCCEVHQNNWYVDIVPQNISKAYAIHYIMNLNKSDEPTLLGAVGDSWNDIPMFEIADESYTFYQSPIEVKQKATHQIEHVYQCIANLEKQK